MSVGFTEFDKGVGCGREFFVGAGFILKQIYGMLG